jgi:hypothetical protein
MYVTDTVSRHLAPILTVGRSVAGDFFVDFGGDRHWLACYHHNPHSAEHGSEAHMRVLVLAAITAISIGMLGLPRASAMPASGIAVGQAAAAANLSQTVRWWRYHRRWHRWHRWHWRRW